MKRFLLSLGFLSLFGSGAHADLKLYTVANPTNAGDVNQVEGIKAALVGSSPGKISAEFLDSKDPDIIAQRIKEDLSKGQKVVVIGAGEGGIDGIEKVTSHPNLIICLTSHMLLERFKDPTVLEKVTFLALPIHVADKDKKILGEKLIETVGVAHNREAGTVEKTFKEWSKELPVCSSYIGVILGGDAPTPPPTKGLKWFTERDAVDLATYVASLVKDKKACVIALNGPRTGKYDAEQNEVLTVHRKGKSDPISELFVQKLKEKEIPVTFFDFQHKTPENKEWVLPYNAFDLIVGALREKEGLLLVPGESTSMISEAIDTLPAGKVLVYKDGPMNEVHDAHVASELNAGRVSVLDDYSQIKNPSTSSVESKPSAAQVIARTLLGATKI